MAKLSDVMVYICINYPQKDHLSKARLTKIVYLSDWKSAIDRGSQITDIKWEFNHYGPYVEDVIEVARSDPRFEVLLTRNYYGDPKEIISVIDGIPEPQIEGEEKRILDFVIERTAPKSWGDFISLVYSTYPIITQLRFSDLDLVSLAQEYKQKVKPLFAGL